MIFLNEIHEFIYESRILINIHAYSSNQFDVKYIRRLKSKIQLKLKNRNRGVSLHDYLFEKAYT